MSKTKIAWHDDSLGRQHEGKTVADYLVARSNARQRASQPHGFVLAIDAGYGEGKSYFIRNLKEELANNHPVALIDAWADDRSRQPFLAILSALENALEPLFDKNRSIRTATSKLVESAGPLLRSALIGATKKALTKVTGEATEGLVKDALDRDQSHAVLANVDRKSAVDDLASNVSEVAESGVEQGIARINGLADSKAKDALLEYRRSTHSALTLKSRLSQIVTNIKGLSGHPSTPIFIFVDELDRCRPTYAIELLEEVKHLFDVAGIVFVLCMHREQLVHSIKSVYGREFDAKAYLDRFVDKTYRLESPSCVEFVERELMIEPLPDRKFLDDQLNQTGAQRIADVFDHFGLSLREMQRALDMIRGCAFLTQDISLDPIFLSMRIMEEFGKNSLERYTYRSLSKPYSFSYTRPVAYGSQNQERVSGESSFTDILFRMGQFAAWDSNTIAQEMKRDKRDAAEQYAFQQISQYSEQFSNGQPIPTLALICDDALRRFKPFVTDNEAED